MFIKLKKNGEEMRINVSNVLVYSPHNDGSILQMNGDYWVNADETPEQIDAKIAKLGVSVGGEY